MRWSNEWTTAWKNEEKCSRATTWINTLFSNYLALLARRKRILLKFSRSLFPFGRKRETLMVSIPIIIRYPRVVPFCKERSNRVLSKRELRCLTYSMILLYQFHQLYIHAGSNLTMKRTRGERVKEKLARGLVSRVSYSFLLVFNVGWNECNKIVR